MPRPEAHILFVTGGTGGHIYPMLSVLDAVKEADGQVRCSYVGTKADLEAPGIRERRDLETHAIHAGKLHRYWTTKQIGEFARLGRGFIEAQTLVSRLRPGAVFAKGSAVSVPVVLAAARLGIPIYSHETDVRSGLANRFAARFAKTVFTAYPTENYPDIDQAKLRYVGQPVRREFYEASTGELSADGRQVDQKLPLITVIGGSQGARGLNALVSERWEAYLNMAQLLHICGPSELERLRELSRHLPENCLGRLFLTAYQQDGLPDAFQRSRVVVNRAGGTIAELAASGSACVLVPLPSAAQDHQRANAAVLQTVGAAVVVQEGQGAEALYEAVKNLYDDTAANQRLRQVIRQFARPRAAADIAEALLRCVHE